MSSSFRLIFLHGLFFVSGATGLGYQLLWTRLLTTGLGHEMPSMLAVVAAFFAGLSLGAWALDGRIARSSRPGRWYAGLEAIIGCWGLVSVGLIPMLSAAAPRLIGIDPAPAWHWAVGFALPLVALLPATVAMGATLPAMERFAAPSSRNGRCVGSLYAANTAGAVAGTLLSAFVLGPLAGMSAGLATLAAANLCCAGAALLMACSGAAAEGGAGSDGRPRQASRAEQPPDRATPSRRSRVNHPALMLFLTGLLGIGFETLAVRAMSQVLENTVYSYAAALTVFLTGTAIGAAIHQRFGQRFTPDKLLAWLLATLAAACLLGAWQLGKAAALHALRRQEGGDSLAAVFTGEMAIAASVMLPPTLVMGALFTHLIERSKLQRLSGAIGQAVAANTAGGAAAPILFGVVLLPGAGITAAIIIVAAGYAALLLVPLLRLGRGVHWLAPLLPAVILIPAAGVSLRPDGDEAGHKGGARVVDYREGVMASVAVLDDGAGRVLQVNNRFNMGSTAKGAVVIQRCQGHIPLLLHPHPKSALFLGTATGITLGAATVYDNLQVDGVELLPEVVGMMRHFSPGNAWPYNPSRVTMHVADARRFVRAAEKKYDVIVADLFHPAADGAAMLYTVEHFRAVRQLLDEGGVFCQWLPLYQLDEATLSMVIRSFQAVFPESRAFMADFTLDLPALGLVGSREAMRYPLPWYPARLAGNEQALATIKAQELRLEDDLRLLGRCAAGAAALRRFAGEGPLNTDDHPRVLYDAPRATARGEHSDHGLLMKLLAVEDDPAAGLVAATAGSSNDLPRRLAGFIKARDAFLRGAALARTRSDTDAPAVVAAYIQSARISEDFTLGYAHALTIALHTFEDNPKAARAILEQLDDAQPRRPAARQWMRKLFPDDAK
jgi:spermidine synthase